MVRLLPVFIDNQGRPMTWSVRADRAGTRDVSAKRCGESHKRIGVGSPTPIHFHPPPTPAPLVLLPIALIIRVEVGLSGTAPDPESPHDQHHRPTGPPVHRDGPAMTRTLSDVVRAICATTSTTPATTHQTVGHSAKNPNIVADTTCTQCGVRNQSEGPDRNGDQPRV